MLFLCDGGRESFPQHPHSRVSRLSSPAGAISEKKKKKEGKYIWVAARLRVFDRLPPANFSYLNMSYLQFSLTFKQRLIVAEFKSRLSSVVHDLFMSPRPPSL